MLLSMVQVCLQGFSFKSLRGEEGKYLFDGARWQGAKEVQKEKKCVIHLILPLFIGRTIRPLNVFVNELGLFLL